MIERATLDRLPPRLLPVLYVGFAHLCLMVAFAAVAVDPRGVAGFFYHDRMLAVVHLITLGWITGSILGLLYVVCPVALRTPVRPGRTDYVAFGLFVAGVSGMVTHFMLSETSGMAWSAVMTWLGIALVGYRVVPRVAAAPIGIAVKAHIGLAFVNVLGAATVGVLLGFDKDMEALPGYVLTNVFAHAHLAALGWATMMVVGVGYRLLPMVIPSAMPSGPSLFASVVLLETGTVGLFVALLVHAGDARVSVALVVAGIVSFLGHIVWMHRHRRPAPHDLPRPDFGARHVQLALAYLGVSVMLGGTLLLAESTPLTLRVALAYGVFGLVGFLSQMIVGLEMRVLPTLVWYWEFAGADFVRQPIPPHRIPTRWMQRMTSYLWLLGVPALAGGLFLDAMPLLTASALALLAGSILATINVATFTRRAFTTTPGGDPRPDVDRQPTD